MSFRWFCPQLLFFQSLVFFVFVDITKSIFCTSSACLGVFSFSFEAEDSHTAKPPLMGDNLKKTWRKRRANLAALKMGPIRQAHPNYAIYRELPPTPIRPPHHTPRLEVGWGPVKHLGHITLKLLLLTRVGTCKTFRTYYTKAIVVGTTRKTCRTPYS